MSCLKRVTGCRKVPLFSAGKRSLVTTGSAGRPQYQGFQAELFWKQWLPVAQEYWAGNEEMLGWGWGTEELLPGSSSQGLSLLIGMKSHSLTSSHLPATKLMSGKLLTWQKPTVPRVWKPLGSCTAQETRGHNKQKKGTVTSAEGGPLGELRATLQLSPWRTPTLAE